VHPVNPDEKLCPDCAETVKAAARKCRFCGYEFFPAPALSPSAASTTLALPSVAPPSAPSPELALETWEVGDLLANLVDKSLVVYEEDTGRYGLLVTVRRFSSVRLSEAEMAGIMHARHLAFFTGLAEVSEPLLRGPEANAPGAAGGRARQSPIGAGVVRPESR
jgi:hypothetical protein